MIRGNRLGDDRDSRYEAKTTELIPGDVLVWYTDGIVECENEAGEEYGEKRFRNSVRRAAALDAGEMRDAIVAEATSFFGDTPRKDDITMIAGKTNGPAPPRRAMSRASGGHDEVLGRRRDRVRRHHGDRRGR